jgi:hypothetical protein
LDITLAQGGRTLRFSPVPSHCLARHRCHAHAMHMHMHMPFACGRCIALSHGLRTTYPLTHLPTYPLTHLPTYPLAYLLAVHTYSLRTAYSAAMARATLVVSYWSAPSSNLSWFDQPPCEAGGRGQDACGETVRLSKLSLRPGPFNRLPTYVEHHAALERAA